MIKNKRAYEPASPDDGYRVLIDRLWPRGIRKDALPIDAWERDLAPSHELRRWFGHDPSRWSEFRSKYRKELAAERPRTILDDLVRRAKRGTVTIVYGARDELHNDAVVVREVLSKRSARRRDSKGARGDEHGLKRDRSPRAERRA